MAIFRKIHTSIWSDSYFSELSKEHKLFFLYLLSNERTKQCGIYEITKKQMAFETGYTIDKVSILLSDFIKSGKIMYNDETFEIAIRNWPKYNYSSSPKVKTCIDKEISDVKDKVLIEYINGIHTLSQEEEEKEQEEEQEEEKKKNNKNIPEFSEFSEYAKINKPNIDIDHLKLKYESWILNGWKDGNGSVIKNWKSKVLNTIPYIKDSIGKPKVRKVKFIRAVRDGLPDRDFTPEMWADYYSKEKEVVISFKEIEKEVYDD